MNLLHIGSIIILVILVIHVFFVNVVEFPYRHLIKTPGNFNSDANSNSNFNANANANANEDEIDRLKASYTGTNTNAYKQDPSTDFNEMRLVPDNLLSTIGGDEDGNGNEKVTNKLPTDHLIQQAVYDPKSDYPVAAANQDVYEKDADFGTEQTNIGQYFSSNPGAFMNDERHNAYVPDTNVWDKQGEQMFQKEAARPKDELQAYNLDDYKGNSSI